MVRGPKIRLSLNRYLLARVFNKSKVQLQNKHTYVFDKSTIILKSFLGQPVNIYKGNLFRRIVITKYLEGFKFGEFTHTRKPFSYPIVKKKKKNVRR